MHMTDRQKLTGYVDAFCTRWRETDASLYIYDSRIKIIFTPAGEIKSIVRDRVSFGPDGQHPGQTVGVHEDGRF